MRTRHKACLMLHEICASKMADDPKSQALEISDRFKPRLALEHVDPPRLTRGLTGEGTLVTDRTAVEHQTADSDYDPVGSSLLHAADPSVGLTCWLLLLLFGCRSYFGLSF